MEENLLEKLQELLRKYPNDYDLGINVRVLIKNLTINK